MSPLCILFFPPCSSSSSPQIFDCPCPPFPDWHFIFEATEVAVRVCVCMHTDVVDCLF